jgi:hypothetical protein
MARLIYRCWPQGIAGALNKKVDVFLNQCTIRFWNSV